MCLRMRGVSNVSTGPMVRSSSERRDAAHHGVVTALHDYAGALALGNHRAEEREVARLEDVRFL